MQQHYEKEVEYINTFFNECFIRNLFKYILDISLEEYTKAIIPQIKQTLDKINSFKDLSQPEEIRNYKIQHFIDIRKTRRLSIKKFKILLETIPALMPLAIMILKMNIYLKKLNKRYFFIDSITINFDNKKLLAELWYKNGFYREETEIELKENFPLVDTYLLFNKTLRKKYANFSKLYKCIEIALFRPLSRLEDRLILDVNSLLDIYCFTNDESDWYVDACGPHYDESVEDKIENIMQLNVYQPKEEKKSIKYAKLYIDAFQEYCKYKYWHKKLTFLIRRFQTKTCYNQIMKDLASLLLDEEPLKDYKNAIQNVFRCPINKAGICQFEKGKSCLNSSWELNRSILSYVFNKDENFYKLLRETFNIKNDTDLIKIIKNNLNKNFSMKLIRQEFPELKDKTDKTISNNFSNYDELIKKYTLAQKNNEEDEEEIYRNEDLDDKEYCNSHEKELECVHNLEELYKYFEQYSLNPSEKIYSSIIDIIRDLEKSINNKKNPNNFLHKMFEKLTEKNLFK